MYTYFNPFTDTVARVSDHDSRVIDHLLEDKENQFLLVYSSFSCSLKIQKWHFPEYAGDYEGVETINEVSLPTMLGSCECWTKNKETISPLL